MPNFFSLIMFNNKGHGAYFESLNPFSKTSTSQLLNINTRFRKSYYDTLPTDFILDLPQEFKNVMSIKKSIQLINNLDQVECFIVEKNGEVFNYYYSRNMKKYIFSFRRNQTESKKSKDFGTDKSTRETKSRSRDKN